MLEQDTAKEEAKKAREDAEQAKEAFRMLAGWAYSERQQHLRLLAEHKTAGIPTQGEDIVGKTKSENGDNESDDYAPTGVKGAQSIEEQVEQLLAEEKEKLAVNSCRSYGGVSDDQGSSTSRFVWS